MTPTEKLEMQVAESDDGSAVVSLHDEPQSEQQEEVKEPIVDAESAQNAQESDNEDGEDGQDDGSTTDPDRDAIRAARREERKLKKQIHKEKARESNHLITALKKQNSELAERLAVLEKRTSGAELARLEKAIDDAGTRVEFAKMKLQDAVNARDGAEVAKAQQLWYDSMRQLESLQSIKENANKQISQPKQNNIQVPDPMVQRMATRWMEKNDWYDPQLRDHDSRIAQTIDQALTEEGFEPSLPEYWEELDERLQKYLPHRYANGYNPPIRNQKPRSVVTSSGRETTGSLKPNEFRLDPERVKAIKDAGMWDDHNARAKMINKFREWDKQNKTRS